MTKLTIPKNWMVLVLEDNEERRIWFNKAIDNLLVTAIPDEAIRHLSEAWQEPFRAVFLDHDLGYTDWGCLRAATITGLPVAQYLAKIQFPGIVVIHSVNPVGAQRMKDLLPFAHVLPFGSFSINGITPIY